MFAQRKYGAGSVPSQRPPKDVPYSPDIQPDLAVTDDMRGKKPAGFPPRGNYTVAVYDSRLPQTIDFSTQLAEETNSSTTTVAEFTVPEGRTFVMKRLGFTLDRRLGVAGQNPTVSLSGFIPDVSPANPEEIPRLTVLVNDRPVENYSNIPVFDLSLNEHSFEAFILIRGGARVGLQCVYSATGYNPSYAAYWRVYGNELLSQGSDITQEPTNLDAIPIKAGFFSRLADAMEKVLKT
jgi:hypothetical protein